MENRSPQPESKFVLLLVGILLTCICLAILGAGTLLFTNSEELGREFNSAMDPSAWQSAETQVAYQPTAQSRHDWVQHDEFLFESAVDSIGWSFGTHKHDLGQLEQLLRKDGYEWDINTFEGMTWWEPGPFESTAEYDVSVVASSIQDLPDLHYGLLFGFQDDKNFFIFQLTPEGIPYFSAYEDGEWVNLVTWDVPPSFRVGRPNKLQVIHEMSNYTFLINDEYLDEYWDDRFSSGWLGLAAGIEQNDAHSTVRFDDFQIRIPRKLVTPTSTRRPYTRPTANSTQRPTPVLVSVPKVIGLSSHNAMSHLQTSGLRVEHITRATEPCSNLIFRQEPRPSTNVSQDSIVKIYSCK